MKKQQKLEKPAFRIWTNPDPDRQKFPPKNEENLMFKSSRLVWRLTLEHDCPFEGVLKRPILYGGFCFLGHKKTLDLDPDPDSATAWIRIGIKQNDWIQIQWIQIRNSGHNWYNTPRCSNRYAVLRIRIFRIHMFFVPPGSGSTSQTQRYGSCSGSGSFYHQE
jgi:hypothetical protein